MIPFPDKKYKTVVIDPPWYIKPNGLQKTKNMNFSVRFNVPYKMMETEEIKAFPINDFAAEQCALFMWTTQGFLRDALTICEYWGFKHSQLLTWDKGGGINWLGFFSVSEFVIFAYRGKYPILMKPGRFVRTTFKAKRGKHSEKPAVFYDLIRPVTPEPRIDIFARKRHLGFDAWGDQVDQTEPMVLPFAL